VSKVPVQSCVLIVINCVRTLYCMINCILKRNVIVVISVENRIKYKLLNRVNTANLIE